MNRLMWTVIVVAGLTLSQPVNAGSSVRYALIIGNNHGDTTQGVELEDLRFAEEEARKIKEKLLNVGNFTDSENRVILLTGKTRTEIMQAAKVLSEQHRLDRQRLGNLPTMFAFFYTGHGLEGKLLTAGEPLTGSDLAEIFRDMGATFTIGVFDCVIRSNRSRFPVESDQGFRRFRSPITHGRSPRHRSEATLA